MEEREGGRKETLKTLIHVTEFNNTFSHTLISGRILSVVVNCVIQIKLPIKNNLKSLTNYFMTPCKGNREKLQKTK